MTSFYPLQSIFLVCARYFLRLRVLLLIFSDPLIEGSFPRIFSFFRRISRSFIQSHATYASIITSITPNIPSHTFFVLPGPSSLLLHTFPRWRAFCFRARFLTPAYQRYILYVLSAPHLFSYHPLRHPVRTTPSVACIHTSRVHICTCVDIPYPLATPALCYLSSSCCAFFFTREGVRDCLLVFR